MCRVSDLTWIFWHDWLYLPLYFLISNYLLWNVKLIIHSADAMKSCWIHNTEGKASMPIIIWLYFCNWIFFIFFFVLGKSAPKTHFHNIIIISQNQTFSVFPNFEIFLFIHRMCNCILYTCAMWSWWIQFLWHRSRWY